MQQIKNRMLLGIASAFGIAVLAVAPVWADHGSSSGTDDSGTGNSGPGNSSHLASTDGTESEPNDINDDNGTDTTTLRQKAQELVAQKRQNVKQHTQAQKQKACEAHAAEINKRATNYATAAQRHLDVFNSIFTKVQAFQTEKQLNVSNYDTLVATATDKQAAAQTAVDNLKALDVSIDCTQSDPATTVAELKTAVKNARTALQDYRTSIKDVVVALKGASTAHTDKSTSTDTTTDTTTGGDQ